VALAAVPSSASARRSATASERAAIVKVVFGSRFPARCGVVYISTVNTTWASAQWIGQVVPTPRVPRVCLALGSNGVAIVHVEQGRWRIVAEGSSYTCPLAGSEVYPGQPSVPNRVADDLVAHLGC
jgi:hypothetical protein